MLFLASSLNTWSYSGHQSRFTTCLSFRFTTKNEKDQQKFLKSRIIDSDKVNNVEIGEHGNN